MKLPCTQAHADQQWLMLMERAGVDKNHEALVMVARAGHGDSEGNACGSHPKSTILNHCVFSYSLVFSPIGMVKFFTHNHFCTIGMSHQQLTFGNLQELGDMDVSSRMLRPASYKRKRVSRNQARRGCFQEWNPENDGLFPAYPLVN